MYFSDVYSDRRIPADLQKDAVLWGECLSGALYWNDFLRTAQAAGFTDPRAMASNVITIQNEELEARVGDIKFYSVTYRLWKIDGLEPDCEDYGQAVAYRGTVAHAPILTSMVLGTPTTVYSRVAVELCHSEQKHQLVVIRLPVVRE